MKRVLLAMLGLLCAANLCIAQVWPAKHERGMASQEMRAGGLSAAHSSIPIGTKVKVINLANGLEIEATVISHIPESDQRIIDLSPSAARALDISSSGPVLISPLAAQHMPTPPVTPPATLPALTTVPAPAIEAETDKQSLNLTINNYMGPEKALEYEPQRPIRQHKFWPDPEPAVVELPPPPPPPPPPPEPEPEPPPPAKPSLFTSPPVANIQIIPGLPDPNTGKIYRLLVGTYPGVDSAYLIYRQLEVAGFSVVQEQAGDWCRVFAAGIPASRVYYAAMRLGAIGFAQVWVHE